LAVDSTPESLFIAATDISAVYLYFGFAGRIRPVSDCLATALIFRIYRLPAGFSYEARADGPVGVVLDYSNRDGMDSVSGEWMLGGDLSAIQL